MAVEPRHGPVRTREANPAAARLLLLLAAKPWARPAFRVVSIALNCDLGAAKYIGLRLPHPYGIVIHSGSSLGTNVTVRQHVTIGVRSDSDLRPPIVGDNVTIGAGAVVLGPITVGSGAVIGANAVVNRDVPAFAIAVGVPARVIGYVR